MTKDKVRAFILYCE